MYCILMPQDENRATDEANMHGKFGEVRTCRSWDIRMHRHPHHNNFHGSHTRPQGSGGPCANPPPIFFHNIVVGWLVVNITRLPVNILIRLDFDFREVRSLGWGLWPCFSGLCRGHKFIFTPLGDRLRGVDSVDVNTRHRQDVGSRGWLCKSLRCIDLPWSYDVGTTAHPVIRQVTLWNIHDSCNDRQRDGNGQQYVITMNIKRYEVMQCILLYSGDTVQWILRRSSAKTVSRSMSFIWPSPHLTLSRMTSFHLKWVCCDWPKPQQTGSLLTARPSSLSPVTAHSVKMKPEMRGKA